MFSGLCAVRYRADWTISVILSKEYGAAVMRSVYTEQQQKKGECVICRLGDMTEYYMELYKSKEVSGTPQEILTLRADIRRCRCGMQRRA